MWFWLDVSNCKDERPAEGDLTFLNKMSPDPQPCIAVIVFFSLLCIQHIRSRRSGWSAAYRTAHQIKLDPSNKIFVSIAGVPGSGKTTLAFRVVSILNQDGVKAACVSMDGYHYYKRDLDSFPNPKRAHEIRGAPETFDSERFSREMISAKEALSENKPVEFPSFDHSVGDPVEKDIEVQGDTRVLVVEGNYLLMDTGEWVKSREVFGLKFYIKVPLAVAGERLAQRHAEAWNWDIEKARARVQAADSYNMLLIEAHGSTGADFVINL